MTTSGFGTTGRVEGELKRVTMDNGRIIVSTGSNHFCIRIDVLIKILTYLQESTSLQKVFPVPFHQNMLPVDKLMLIENRGWHSWFS